MFHEKKAKKQSALDKFFRRVGRKKSQIRSHECPSFLVKFSHTDEGAFLAIVSLWTSRHTGSTAAQLGRHPNLTWQSYPLLVCFHGPIKLPLPGWQSLSTQLVLYSFLFFPDSDPLVTPQPALSHLPTLPSGFHPFQLIFPPYPYGSLINRTGRKPLKIITYAC